MDLCAVDPCAEASEVALDQQSVQIGAEREQGIGARGPRVQQHREEAPAQDPEQGERDNGLFLTTTHRASIAKARRPPGGRDVRSGKNGKEAAVAGEPSALSSRVNDAEGLRLGYGSATISL